jgi:hypothetical protein
MKAKITAVVLGIAVALLMASVASAKPEPFYFATSGNFGNCTGPSNTSGDTFGRASANVKAGTVRVRLTGVSANTTYNVEVNQLAGGGCFSFANGSVETNSRGDGSTTLTGTFFSNATTATVKAFPSGSSDVYITIPITL